jgi:RecB family endonuclease NucS
VAGLDLLPVSHSHGGASMPEVIRIWQVDKADVLTEIKRSALDLEARIEKWVSSDISLLSPDLLIIGEQVKTASGNFIDLLCIDRSGSLVIVELKRDKTPREVAAQALDYASWVKGLGIEEIDGIAALHLKGETLSAAFQAKFGIELPEVINDHHAMRVVASEIDDSTDRIIHYLA